jgi:hypothetical protein
MSFILGIVTSIVNGVVGPLFGFLNKKQDTQLEGFKVAGTVDVQAYQAYLAYRIEAEKARVSANGWWGPRVVFMIIAVPVGLHVAAVFIDSTFTGGTLKIPALPTEYLNTEHLVLGAIFGASVVGQMSSSIGSWLKR